MLKTSKSISISGNSTIEGKTVATMNASVPDGGNISISTYITDKVLYDANKAAVQADIEAFNELVYGMEV